MDHDRNPLTAAVAPPPPPGGAARPFIRRLFVESLLREMKRLDPRCRRLLMQHNLWARRPVGLYANVPLADYVAFFEDAARLLDRPALGLELGQQFRLWEVGPVYHLLTSARTLREAFAVFIRFQRIWQSHTTMRAEPGETGATRYSYRIEDSGIWPRRQDAENVMAALCTMVRQLLSERWKPLEVRFEHAIGVNRTALEDHFRCRILELGESNSILLSDQELDRPLLNGPRRKDFPDVSDTMAVVEHHLLELLSPAEMGTPALNVQLARLIAGRLGRESVTLEDLAAILGMAPRTLRRQLADLGQSFGGILAQERQRRAQQLLESGRIRLEDVARHLGYASPAAFSRAYRGWTGHPPRDALMQARGRQRPNGAGGRG